MSAWAIYHGPCGDDVDTDDEWLDCEDWWVIV